MKNDVNNRIAALRQWMAQEHLAAFIFPSSDPHNSEYLPDRWKAREWISGFDGSAGMAVVTLNAAALWTDSRYFLAAEEQLAGTDFVLMRQGLAGVPKVTEWLAEQLADVPSPEVGVDGTVTMAADVEALTLALRSAGGITLRTNADPLEVLWKDRPGVPDGKIEVHPLEYAGESVGDKLARVRKALRAQHADGMLVSALDEVAWTLNIRGNDVHCNPVAVSFLLISTTRATLYINKEKVPADVEAYLKENGVGVRNYDEVVEGLKSYEEYNLLMDAATTSHELYRCGSVHHVVNALSPIAMMKAVKNETEREGFRRAMLRDGVALVHFLHWLLPAVQKGGETEMSIDRKLTALRAAQPLYRGLSFDTIAGYGAHGAIVHYEATPESDAVLEPRGLLLLDSGAQYRDGTTDITRTIALGPLTDEERLAYTLVLRGHIQLQLCKFPNGASGTQLDALARELMWREGMNFMHGTGHGVGSYLNVHEGPHQIRMEYKPAPLRAGMTVTDEPGLYVAGKFGVRIENTLLIRDYMTTAFGQFLEMETLTLCPIDKTPILRERMLPEEVEWLNNYHQRVWDELSPLIEENDVKQWLADACAPL